MPKFVELWVYLSATPLFGLTATLVVYVLAQAVRMGWQLKTKPEDVKAIGTSDYPLPAPRPANSLLDTSLVQQNLGLVIPTWESGVLEVLSTLWAQSAKS